MPIQRRTEFSMYLADRPGELAGVLEAAQAAGVEVEALVVGNNHDRGLVRLIGTPEHELRRVLESLVDTGAGPAVESSVVVVPCGRRPGIIREIAAKLALAGVNVEHAYSAPDAAGGLSYVLRVSDEDQAARTLEQLT